MRREDQVSGLIESVMDNYPRFLFSYYLSSLISAGGERYRSCEMCCSQYWSKHRTGSYFWHFYPSLLQGILLTSWLALTEVCWRSGRWPPCQPSSLAGRFPARWWGGAREPSSSQGPRPVSGGQQDTLPSVQPWQVSTWETLTNSSF